MHYAGFWRRFIPYLIDLMVGFAILYLSLLLFSAIHNHIVRLGLELINILGYSLAIILSTTLMLFCWTHWGMTLGKLLFGIKIVDRNGANLTLEKSVIRLVGYLLCSLPFSLGFLWVAFDKKKQGIHDKMAESFVVKL